ncbi:MAG: RHS repeat-associated core domain-containing protein [Syntrophobacteraceae bacterium]
MNGSGAVTAVCAYGPNGLLSRWSYQEGPSYYTGPVYYMYDPSGNVAQYLYASSGGYVNADYDAYGLNYTDGYGNPVPPPFGQPFGYQAQWGARTDRETGLVLMGWRYYDPAAGRFLTRDPIGYEGGINLYAYCRNNPGEPHRPAGAVRGFRRIQA